MSKLEPPNPPEFSWSRFWWRSISAFGLLLFTIGVGAASLSKVVDTLRKKVYDEPLALPALVIGFVAIHVFLEVIVHNQRVVAYEEKRKAYDRMVELRKRRR